MGTEPVLLNQDDFVVSAESVEEILNCLRLKRKIDQNQKNYYRNNHLFHIVTFANCMLSISAVTPIPVEISLLPCGSCLTGDGSYSYYYDC